MLKLGKLTDYAIAVMVQLAREGGSRSAHHLSQKTGIPEPTVGKVLKALARTKLVSSERGVAGGYKISVEAGEISIGHIIEAMDGPVAIVSCVEGASDVCGAEATCPAKGKWAPVNNAIRDALHAVKLSGMVAPSCGAIQPARRVYQITGASHVHHE